MTPPKSPVEPPSAALFLQQAERPVAADSSHTESLASNHLVANALRLAILEAPGPSLDDEPPVKQPKLTLPEEPVSLLSSDPQARPVPLTPVWRQRCHKTTNFQWQYLHRLPLNSQRCWQVRCPAKRYQSWSLDDYHLYLSRASCTHIAMSTLRPQLTFLRENPKQNCTASEKAH